MTQNMTTLDIKIPSKIAQFGYSKDEVQNHVEEWK